MPRTPPPVCDREGCFRAPLVQIVDLAGVSQRLCRRHCRDILETAVFAAPTLPTLGGHADGATVTLPIVLTRWDDASWVSESA